MHTGILVAKTRERLGGYGVQLRRRLGPSLTEACSAGWCLGVAHGKPGAAAEAGPSEPSDTVVATGRRNWVGRDAMRYGVWGLAGLILGGVSLSCQRPEEPASAVSGHEYFAPPALPAPPAEADAGATSGETASTSGILGEIPAFPGAAGFGANATGGRGGAVLKVTSVGASGPGSLQEALNRPGPRIIVFAVSGVIDADVIEIPHGDLTIAGQTAPGGGITIRGRLNAGDGTVDNVIIRHIRVRPAYDGSDGQRFDAIQLGRSGNVILDHISASFAVDETIDLFAAHDVTVQWSTIESSAMVGHPEGAHNFGLINGPDGGRISVLLNLFAHHRNRCPALATGPADVRNNVIYNVQNGFVHHNPAKGQFNIVGNYFKVGPSSPLTPYYFDDENDTANPGLGYFLWGNWLDGTRSKCRDGAMDNPWRDCTIGVGRGQEFRSKKEFNFARDTSLYRPPATLAADDAYATVLAHAGAFPRDVIAQRSVQDVRGGGGGWGDRIPTDLMEGLIPVSAPADTDGDGIPDAWEAARGLDQRNGKDSVALQSSGYTAIEEYVNELANSLVAP